MSLPLEPLREILGPTPMVSLAECVAIYEAVLRLQARHVLEIGTGLGHSTCALACAVRETGGRLVSCDNLALLGGNAQARANVGKLGLESWVSFVELDSQTWVPTPNRLFGLAFLDSSHHYAQTKVEIAKVVGVLGPRGEVYLHDVIHEVGDPGDFCHPFLDINRAVLEYLRANQAWNYEVLNTTAGCLGLGRMYRHARGPDWSRP
jgi:predicted O-methyltransferase YrrM